MSANDNDRDVEQQLGDEITEAIKRAREGGITTLGIWSVLTIHKDEIDGEVWGRG